MSRINKPVDGGNIYRWALDVTREVNSLQPTAGPGQKITKTGAGTTYSVDGTTIPLPDSSPKIVGTVLSGETSAYYGTTYSIERNEQNAFSLFGFNQLSGATTIEDYPLSTELSGVDVLVRDRGTDWGSVLSAPTLRYVPISSMLGATQGKLPWETEVVWDAKSFSLVRKYYECTLHNGIVTNLRGLSAGTSVECDLSSLILSGIVPTSSHRFRIDSILEPLSSVILTAVPEQI